MGMKEMPEITTVKGGKIWTGTYENFKVKVYLPDTDLPVDIINFGFTAPYQLIFEEKEMSLDEAIDFAETNGFAKIAKEHGSSVVFVYPTCDGGWEKAPYELFVDLIAESKIHQYFKDGVVTMKNRFTGEIDGYAIRGAIFRTLVYGFGKSADFIAKNYLKKVDGEYLWGPGEITPTLVSLERLQVKPEIERFDIPVISIGNSDEINEYLKKNCEQTLIKDKADYIEDYKAFSCRFKRWCGKLIIEDDFEKLGLVEEPSFETVKTSPDNLGDYKDQPTHEVGYIAYYNKGLLDNGPVPTVFGFHGGGDSAMHLAYVSGWYEIAHKYNFLLILVENHLNTTATETIEFINKLKKKYPIDEKRIYASGFSMGGCKSWDLYQEYPEVFAGLAPMDATFEVGFNIYGKPAPKEINKNVSVPIFYSGGEITPLPELPFQAEKCWDRMRYVFEINKLKTKYDVKFEDKENWADPIWGISGDKIARVHDDECGSVLTLNYFESEDGVFRTVFTSVSGQGHECRHHTCEQAWLFLSQFSK